MLRGFIYILMKLQISTVLEKLLFLDYTSKVMGVLPNHREYHDTYKLLSDEEKKLHTQYSEEIHRFWTSQVSTPVANVFYPVKDIDEYKEKYGLSDVVYNTIKSFYIDAKSEQLVRTRGIFDSFENLKKLHRNPIYQFFDKNGIPGRHEDRISILGNVFGDVFYNGVSETIFIPNLHSFGLTVEDAEKVIINYVYDTTGTRITSVNDLMKMRNVNGKPFFLLLNEHDRSKIRYCLAFGKLPGSVIFRDTDSFRSLGNISEIDGDLGFSDSNIQDVGALKKVNGSIWIAQSGKGIFTQLKTLGGLEFVGKDLNIKKSPIENLGELKHVGGNLNLRHTSIKNLGKLEYIGGNLLVSRRNREYLDLSKVKLIGKLKLFEDKT